MSEKYLIVGATGSIGSNLAEQMHTSGKEIHLVGRDESQLEKLSEKLNSQYTVTDVLDDGFVDKIKSDISDIKGLAYCVGSIDLKPLRTVKKQDIERCLNVNFFPIVEIIKVFQDNLKRNKGSIVLFSTVAVQKGFTNHSIISSTKGAIEGLTVSLACLLYTSDAADE